MRYGVNDSFWPGAVFAVHRGGCCPAIRSIVLDGGAVATSMEEFTLTPEVAARYVKQIMRSTVSREGEQIASRAASLSITMCFP